MSNSVLLVDDDPCILSSLRRLFEENDLLLFTASGGHEALEIVAREKPAVIVSDNMMPGMRGLDLLARVKRLSPDTVRVVMTAYADLDTAVQAINRSEAFRFVIKPWDDMELVRTVFECLDRHRLVATLRSGDEALVRSLIRTIELKDPYTRGHCERVATLADELAKEAGLGEGVRRAILFGSWLHDCGKIGVPEGVLTRGGPLESEEREIIMMHPLWGADVARQALLPEEVVEIILYHHERWDGKGYPCALRGEEIPVSARVVAVADVFDALNSDRPYRAAFSTARSLEEVRSLRGTYLDPRFADLLQNVLAAARNQVEEQFR